MDKGRLSDSTFEFNPTLSDCNYVQGLSMPMSPADELFCNGRIRPMKPSVAPQKTPLPNFEYRSEAQSSEISKKGNDMEEKYRGRQNKNESRHRGPARSLSPERNSSSQWQRKGKGQKNSVDKEGVEGIKVAGFASPSIFPKPRGSRRSWSLRDIFLPRSKSEGREQESDGPRLSFSRDAKSLSSDKAEKMRAPVPGKPAQKKKMVDININKSIYISSPNRKGVPVSPQDKPNYTPSPNRRGVPVSAHELHYTANRAQAEELRRKTFLPYRQGVLGCLGFLSPPTFPQGHVLHSLY